MSQQTDVLEQIRHAVDQGASGRVFGDPVSQDGITILPVAKVSGGGGGGSGTGPAPQDSDAKEASGSGGGFGVSARPVGVYVIKEGAVSWRPTVDVNKVIIGGQIVAVVALLTIRAIFRRR